MGGSSLHGDAWKRGNMLMSCESHRMSLSAKQAEDALRASEEKLNSLLDHIPGVSIQGYTTKGTVFYWNKASKDVYGFTAQEALGRYLGGLIIPPYVKPHFESALALGARATESGKLMPSGELLLLHKYGYLVPVYSIHMVVCQEGSSNLLYCIDVDLTERKKMEEELKASYAMLEEEVAVRTKELVLSNEKMQHEIEERRRVEVELRRQDVVVREQKRQLEQINNALHVLLDHLNQEKKKLGEDIALNMRKLVMPYLERLKVNVSGHEGKTLVNIITSNLENLTQPFGGMLSLKGLDLTPMEIQIANLIQQGYSSKDISSALSCSYETVSFHRKNIRKKLDLTSKKTNLRSYLQRYFE
jgi:PAS domain S-box-containing protein